MAVKEIRRVTLRTNPQMFDRVIQELQQGLAKELDWLTHSFGRCERLVQMKDGRRVYTPNLYIGKNEYLRLSPDSGLGNYSFVCMGEPEQVISPQFEQVNMKAPFSLIVWVDMRTIGYDDERNTEDIKAQVLRVCNQLAFIRSGYVHVDRVYNHAENVFQGFSLDEVDNQFLMSPYSGWRFTGELIVRDVCRDALYNYLYVEPEEVQWIDESIDYDIYSNTYWKVIV